MAPTDSNFDETIGAIAQGVCCATVLPLRSVGVQGDSRTYSKAASLRLTEGALIDWDVLDGISTSITNSSSLVNRVLLQLSGHDGHTMHVHPASPDPSRVAVLQLADKVVHEHLVSSGWMAKVWQFPVVLAPLSPEGSKSESVILRPVDSTEAMTAQFSKLPQELVETIVADLMALDGVCAVFFDVTNKPPGTIEWE